MNIKWSFESDPNSFYLFKFQFVIKCYGVKYKYIKTFKLVLIFYFLIPGILLSSL